MRPSVVATACLVAIMAQGPGHHCVKQTESESILEPEGVAAPVVSSCVQMPSLAAIEEVERHSWLPTLSAATATTWGILSALELEPVAPGAGALLGSVPETVVPRPLRS